MAMSYEFERHIQVAREAKDEEALGLLQAQQAVFNGLREAGKIQELPLETRPIETPAQAASEPSAAKIEVFTSEQLTAEFERLAARHQELEFHRHKKLRISAGILKDTIMRLMAPQPENFRGRFDTLAVAIPQIPIEDQANMAGLKYYLKGLNVRDWDADPKGYRTPTTPYATWMQDGKINLNRSVRDVRGSLAGDERGATLQDGIALYVANPSVLNGHYIDLPGTSVGSGGAPCLGRWHGGPRVFSRHVVGANSNFGSASCGRVVA